ncbi:hypothetical protein C8Q70DRAFT_215164 [Cubamyces menziesii]|nr:hypothetical protein C8Q70DRAFT_215164 [Cubamyces menziesii]
MLPPYIKTGQDPSEHTQQAPFFPSPLYLSPVSPNPPNTTLSSVKMMKNMLAFILAAVLVSSGNAFPLAPNNDPVSVLTSVPVASSSATFVTSSFTSLPSPSASVNPSGPVASSTGALPSASPTDVSTVFISIPSEPSPTSVSVIPTDTSVYITLPSTGTPSPSSGFSSSVEVSSVFTSIPNEPSFTSESGTTTDLPTTPSPSSSFVTSIGVSSVFTSLPSTPEHTSSVGASSAFTSVPGEPSHTASFSIYA